jgi:adenylate kinase family enzyme
MLLGEGSICLAAQSLVMEMMKRRIYGLQDLLINVKIGRYRERKDWLVERLSQRRITEEESNDDEKSESQKRIKLA